jgi:hypothetical protein
MILKVKYRYLPNTILIIELLIFTNLFRRV